MDLDGAFTDTIDPTALASLRERVRGTVLARGEEARAAVASHNTLRTVDPDVVVVAASEEDVATALRFASDEDLPVHVHSTGHGTMRDVTGGLVVSTVELDDVGIDPATRLASIGAGVRWAAVIDAGAVHGLAPITGSSPGVGVVGYVLGGGLGPLARSHGYTSDRVRGFRVALVDGSLVDATADSEPDLFWALRGGKGGLGVVTRVDLELVPLRTLYGGSLLVDTPHVEQALRAWVDWTATAPDDVTTSVALIAMPPFEQVPEPLRGRFVLSLRFAYPGDPAEGERLAAPLRAAAPALVDSIREMPPTEVGSIHADPEDAGPSWIHGGFLGPIDQDFATRLLGALGPDAGSPFVAVELRHLGGAAARDVDGGSATGGRDAAFTFAVIGVDPGKIEEMAYLADEVAGWSRAWAAERTNINFLPAPWTAESLSRAWSPETAERLARVRAAYDPHGLLGYGAA